MPKPKRNEPQEIKPDSPEPKAASPKVNGAALSEPSGAPKVVRAGSGPKKRTMPLWGWLVIGLVVVAGSAVGGYLVWSSPSTTNVNGANNQNAPVKVQDVPRVLDGLLVPPDQANPNILAVMIENAYESRPPSNLDRASIVYEALAEGGITRFMALFLENVGLNEVGPIRSARPYYVDWASEYNRPLYVHAGESPQAALLIRSKKTTVLDLNLLRYGKYGYRDRKRSAPHNLYSTSKMLTTAFTSLYPGRKQKYTSWSYADDPAIDQRPEVTKPITIEFSSRSYQVQYVYDRALNQYQRKLAGQNHVTRQGANITAKNVVVQFVRTGLYPRETQRLKMETTGSGKALVFRNGVAVVGTWKKDTTSNRTVFFDANGQAVTLTRGNTWVEVVPTDRAVTY